MWAREVARGLGTLHFVDRPLDGEAVRRVIRLADARYGNPR